MVSGGFDVVDFMLFCIAAVLSPPVISRRFGGYRIVPKACNTTDESTGVCMFNNDCTKINGTVAGSCTDGFLFGSCCKLTEGSYYISVPLSLNPLTSSEGLVIPETISTTNKVNVPSNLEDTVLLHHDGTVVQSPYKPVDFIFNSRPDLFLSNGSYEDPLGDKYLSSIVTTERPATNPKPTESWWVTKDSNKPNKQTTMNSIYKSSTKFILSSSGVYNPTTESSQYDDYNGNYVSQHQTNYQGIKDVTNQASIYHILNILNETDPVAPDKTSSTTHESHFPTTITRYPSTVTRYPVAVTTRYNSTYSNNYYTTRKPFVTVKPTSKPCKPSIYTPTSYPNKHNLLVVNNKGCLPDDQDVTIGQNTNIKHKPQIIINTTPQITVDPHKIVTTTKYNKTHKPYPTVNYNKYTTSKPTTHYFNYLTATTKPPKRPQYSSPPYDYNKKKNSTHYVHLTGIQVTSEVNVTPKPGGSSNVVYDPIPTVILLETPNTTPKPTKTAITIQTPQNTIISVNSNGNVATYRPPSTTYAGSQTPVYTVSPSSSYGGVQSSPGVSNYVRPVTEQLGPMYTVVNSNPKPEQYNPISSVPLFEPVNTILTTPTQVLKITPNNSSEILVAFPPDRDPSANISYLRPDPEIVSWVSTKPDDTLELLDNDSNGIVIEDDKFDTKVHSFVEKIVQNLQGNFVDLENVLIDGQTNATVTPTKKPSKPTKPPKKPSKKPTTLVTVANVTRPLITKPPPRPVSSTQRPVKVTETVVTIKPTKPVTESSTILSDSEEYTPERINKECGIRPLMKNGRIVGGKGATFGEWPWQVLVREATWLGLFTKNKCGGVLITNRYVVTAAHCQPGFLASLIAVFGEYDISGEIESRRSVSRNVRRVIVHRYYNAATFENDVSLLELETPVQFDKHIIPICMPQDGDDFTGKVATVTGWGRLKYGGGVPSVLQEVHVPVIDNNVCQEMFHTAGHSKTILSSFICAGYANGQRDSCEGDSGGPLMVEREDGHWVLAGTVSHGIKCAAPYLPGVYMRTTYYKPWISTITGVKNL